MAKLFSDYFPILFYRKAHKGLAKKNGKFSFIKKPYSFLTLRKLLLLCGKKIFHGALNRQNLMV